MVNFKSLALLVLILCLNCSKKIEPKKEAEVSSDYKLKTLILDSKLNETSGLEFWNGHFWTFNDSGGEPELYSIDEETGDIKHTIKISNGKNTDWEDISQDYKNIYIGDFGNNYGNRKNLKIYIIPKKEINLKDKKLKLKAQVIEFNFPEQMDFSKQNRNHDFDLESMAVWKGKIHLFTKQWKNEGTKHYTLKPKAGKQEAKRIEEIPLDFLVTAADIGLDKSGNAQLYFIGYSPDGQVFLLQQPLDSNSNFFDSQRIITNLGRTAEIGQTEGLNFSSGKLCISAEAYKFEDSKVKQSMHCLIR